MGHFAGIRHNDAPRTPPRENPSRREERDFTDILDSTAPRQQTPSHPYVSNSGGGAHPELTETGDDAGSPTTYGPDEGEFGILPGGDLDEIRQGYREDQRTALEGIHNSTVSGPIPLAPTDQADMNEGRETNLAALTAAIVNEIDYAATTQAVPDFDALVESIRAQAPDDPYLARAIEDARAILEASWELEGRTGDRIGTLLEIGETGTPAEVEAEAQRQFEALAEQVAADLGEEATPEAIAAALMTRLGVYATYLPDGMSAEAWNGAIQSAAEKAIHEVLVVPEIERVLEAAESGGEDWATAAMAALREVTDPLTHTPQQVAAIVGDPRIQGLVEDALGGAESLGGDGGPGHPTDTQVLVDFSAVAQAAFMAGDRAFVDNAAAFFTEEVLANVDAGMKDGLLATLSEAAGQGNIAFGLALATRDPDGNAYGRNILDRIASGIAEFRGGYEAFREEAMENADAIAVPLETWGGEMSEDEQTEALANLLAADPDLEEELVEDGERQLRFAEQIEGMQMALDVWGPALTDDPGYAGVEEAFGELPEINESMFPADLRGTLPEAGEPGAVNPWWFVRSLRYSASALAQVLTKKFTSPETHNWLWHGSQGYDNLRPAARVDKGLSSWLFFQNATSLWGGELVDGQYIIPHMTMASMHATNAFLPDTIKSYIFGLDENNRSPAFNYAAGKTGLDALQVADDSRPLFRTILSGVFKDPLDFTYIALDGAAAVAYFTGADWMLGEDAEPDPVRGVAFSISVLSNASFVLSNGAAFANTALLGLRAGSWNAVGAALFVIASGLNYAKGHYDLNHGHDSENAAFLEAMGVDENVADRLANGSQTGSGRFLVAAFHEAGYTTEEMVTFMNRWTPQQAEDIVTFIKMNVDHPEDGGDYTAEQFAEVAEWAAATMVGSFPKDPIPFPTPAA